MYNIEIRPYLTSERYLIVRREIAEKSGGIIIDVGCGEYGPFLLSQHPNNFVIGVDYNRAYLEEAGKTLIERGRSNLHRVNLVRADARHLPLKSHCADYVIDLGCSLWRHPVHDEIIQECIRVTRSYYVRLAEGNEEKEIEGLADDFSLKIEKLFLRCDRSKPGRSLTFFKKLTL